MLLLSQEEATGLFSSLPPYAAVLRTPRLQAGKEAGVVLSGARRTLLRSLGRCALHVWTPTHTHAHAAGNLQTSLFYSETTGWVNVSDFVWKTQSGCRWALYRHQQLVHQSDTCCWCIQKKLNYTTEAIWRILRNYLSEKGKIKKIPAGESFPPSQKRVDGAVCFTEQQSEQIARCWSRNEEEFGASSWLDRCSPVERCLHCRR